MKLVSANTSISIRSATEHTADGELKTAPAP